jgi:hydrogenase/urease accessory protein HupE
MHWASVYVGGAGLLVPSAERQVIAFVPSVGNMVFLLFGQEVRALLLSETVGVLGLLALWGGKSGIKDQQSLEPEVYLGVWWQAAGAHKAAEALGSTCVGVWASRSHGSCWRHGEPSLWTAGVLGPAFQAWTPGW